MASPASCDVVAHKRRRWVWCDIPEDLLSLIFQHMSDFSDLHQCSCVCRFWRSTASTLCRRITKAPLLLAIKPTDHHARIDDEEEELGNVLVFDKEEKDNLREFSLRPPTDLVTKNCAIAGADKGWLLLCYRQHESVFDSLVLYNPITRVRVPMPPPFHGEVLRFSKLCLSTTPTDSNCVVFVQFCLEGSHTFQGFEAFGSDVLALCKPGDQTWAAIKRTGNRYHDMSFYKGELYAVDYAGTLFRIKQSEEDQQVIEEDVVLDYKSNTLVDKERPCFFYLVEEPCTGQLFVVEQAMLPDSPSTTFGLRVFNLKCYLTLEKSSTDIAATEWEEVTSFGSGNHQLLLLRPGGSVFVSTLDNTDFKPNSIYFIGRDSQSYSLEVKVYDMESHTFCQHSSSSCSRFVNRGLACIWFKASTV